MKQNTFMELKFLIYIGYIFKKSKLILQDFSSYSAGRLSVVHFPAKAVGLSDKRDDMLRFGLSLTRRRTMTESRLSMWKRP